MTMETRLLQRSRVPVTLGAQSVERGAWFNLCCILNTAPLAWSPCKQPHIK